MIGESLLDTNAMIAFLNGDFTLREHVADSPRLYLSIVVLAELYFGAHKSNRTEENLARIDNLIFTSSLIYCDHGTAWEYGLIKNELRAKGRLIPEGDIWIAATARQHKLSVVTRDRHFEEIERLQIVKL
jgi:tRNA(fMet)-specific endonuclease VapC